MLVFAFLFTFLQAHSGEYITPDQTPKTNSFAVFTDTQTWLHCKDAILEYQKTLNEEGLPSFVIADNWQNPEQVKEKIFELYKNSGLEGVVFIGDIPVPMIRKAQHLTSAFKMNEKAPMFESSVPSDRFYDDLDLKFDFIKRDSLKPLFFYYDLSTESPQEIRCDIYSGRIKPINNGIDPYEQINRYLEKTVREHKTSNHLNQFVSYTGEGSYSNSLSAWESEPFTIREQFPGIFDSLGRARFYRYSFDEFPKDNIADQLRRNDLDMMIFHEHGTPDRQYIAGTYPSTDTEGHIRLMKEYLRNNLRNSRYTQEDIDKRIRERIEKYQIDSTWFAGYQDAESIREDSLTDLRRGLLLTDVSEIAPNVRFLIFDACYNGDFREDDYIAGRYIFSGGNCVATFANSVNVLQDKSANDLLGLLGLGARVGQWAQLTNILESHITGDPTYRFTSNDPDFDFDSKIFLNRTPENKKLLKILKKSSSPDVRIYALIHLYRNGYQHISELLRRTYENSPSATERYYCMHLLENINDSNYHAVLRLACEDSYEFTRRIAVNRMGKVGLNEFLPYLIRSYFENREAERVVFNITFFTLPLYPETDVREAARKYLESSFFQDKEKTLEDFMQKIRFGINIEMDKAITDKSTSEKNRIFWISNLKNNHYNHSVEKYISIIKDENEPENVRIALLESLAWFRLSYKSPMIQQACKEMISSSATQQSVKNEAKRTLNQLAN